MTNPIGLYLHVPFCEKKCKYCDFYSTFVTEELLDNYTQALIKEIHEWGGKLKNRPIDTIYLGGGTPSLLSHRLPWITDSINKAFTVLKNTEITLEFNPAGNSQKLLECAKEAGVNRLSIGLQSGIDRELKVLGRTHTVSDSVNTVKSARRLDFDNISLDIMLGLPDSDDSTLTQSLDFLKNLNPEHISAYLLKIEEKTAFYALKDRLLLPDDDKSAEQYLLMCDYLENNGYRHYEISNFCKSGKESRHNLKYWNLDEYLGIGASAHSFLNGKRFYYPRDLKGFLNGNSPLPDGEGGDREEYIMLRLRLKDGIYFDEYEAKFGEALPKIFYLEAERLEKSGLVNLSNCSISLTNKGMLLQNSIITKITECIE